ncbi:hypothetical protein [Blattabacterium cuenoti]|uniref:hypothetical protein n=1 Tax=Blattabacterium cuenoti TaxID=1653831 RepID=UPI00163CC23A|nr:hypothetical protein [Blattabacterium cuenoti]
MEKKKIVNHRLNGSMEQFISEKKLEEQEEWIEYSIKTLKKIYHIIKIEKKLFLIHKEKSSKNEKTTIDHV